MIVEESISLNFEDNVIDGKFSSFSKMNLRISRQTLIDLIPTRSISTFQYQKLLEESPLLFYTLKVHYKRGEIQDYIMTSIPMCLILQSHFQYTLNLLLNENGYLSSINILVKNSTKNDSNYQIILRFQSNEVGPQPNVQHFLDKLKREREEKLLAQENDNRPFILKYWKYLLPIVVIFVLQSAFTDGGGGR